MARGSATTETVVDGTTVDNNETEVSRIPEILAQQSILGNLCEQYLLVVDEINAYNKDVLAEKTADWNPSKVLAEARKMVSPEDASIPVNEDLKKAWDVWEALVGQAALARKAVIEMTAQELGIVLTVTAERSPETEAPLKEKRKFANEIGTQLMMISKLSTDAEASSAVAKFLEDNSLPAVGRDQARTFGENEKSTPKYRVNVVVSRDGVDLINEAGFTKTALVLKKYYERGQAPTAEILRTHWEKAGNTVENTVQNPVVVVDEEANLTFTIAKR